METFQVEDMRLELTKINAIKLKNILSESRGEDKDNTDSSIKKNQFPQLSVSFVQDDDNRNISFNVSYKIPMAPDESFLFEAELSGMLYLKESIIFSKIINGSTGKEYFNEHLLPSILKEVDNKLIPIFKSMNLEYNRLT